MVADQSTIRQRQVLWWRAINAMFNLGDVGSSFESMAVELAQQESMPLPMLEASMGIDVLLHRHPELKPHFDELKQLNVLPNPSEEDANKDSQENASTDDSESAEPTSPHPDPIEDDSISHARTFAFSKLLLNVFGPNTQGGSCSAGQYKQWCDDVAALEECFGFGPGQLRDERGGPANPSLGGSGAGTSGNAPRIDDDQLREELVAMESDLIKRMDILEVLKDDRLAARLTPSMALVEQLLYGKSNLSGVALKNAKILIRKYVDELADVLKKEVVSASTGKIDRSVPPKRIYRNLDLKRTVWKNLHNFNPADERLYVDQLYYHHTSQKELNKYLIVVVDQSGSMISAMVQCAILASIFASLPRIKVSLIAFDTNVIDLTEWVEDPFESLMRTNLGGGNDGPKAMEEARTHITDPTRTTMVWISDFYEFHNDKPLFEMIKAVKQTGVHFIPVGSVSGTGYYSVNEWFKKALKSIGLPVLTGNIKKLIKELKKQLN